MMEESPIVESSRPAPALKSVWKHLRIPYQLTLAPIFLLGYCLASPTGWQILPPIVILHFLIYPGITAYNSYYDRDTGPIGGLREPPAATLPLLKVGLGLKAAGLLAALWVGYSFAAVIAAFLSLSVLYSHPRFRWKSDPWLSAVVVGLGQGGLGFLGGWTAARGSLIGITDIAALYGLASACLTVLGMYPLTQLFQIPEDAARGDRTICVVLGVEGALTFSSLLLVAGGACAAAMLAFRRGPLDSALILAGYLGLMAATTALRRGYYEWSRDELFRRITTLQYSASAAFGVFILLRLTRWG